MKYLSLLLFFVLITTNDYAQIKVSLIIKDESNHAISFANIKIKATKNTYTIADSIGHASYLISPNLFHEIEITSLGFSKKNITVFASSDTLLLITLENNETLKEVTISENKFLKSSSSNNNGVIEISKNTLDALPNIGGEKDIIKAIQLLPGVQSGNEGTRGIFIRGGSPDQTLILLDKTPIYNATHLYGFMSVFNGESIDKVEVYKNHYPARFGSRLGAVVDIQSNFGNDKKIKGSATIGFISSRLNVEGPLGKNKNTTFNISLRGSYVGLYSKPISKRQFEKAGYDGSISYNFYDVNFAVAHRFSEKDIIKISSFYSQDLFEFKRGNHNSGDNGFEKWKADYEYSNLVNWRNNTFTAQWIHKKSERLISETTFYISNYNLNSRFNETETYSIDDSLLTNDLRKYNNKNYIRDYALNNQWTYLFEKNKLMFGAKVTYRPYQIGNGRFQKERIGKNPIDTTYGNTLNKTLENTLFIENEYQINDKISFNCGFHVVHYLHKKNNFFSFQPRISLLASPTKNIHIRASFLTSTQNIHLLTSGSAIVLTDLWVPATLNLKPENAWQVSGGIQIDFFKQFIGSIDAYYKKLNNVIEYKNGVNKILIGDNWEKQILGGGKGEAYGVEFYVSKTKGKFTVWAKYNLGWSTRQFDQLNNGKKYFYKYDRRHDVSIALAYKLNKHFDFSIAWVYASGNWMSLWKTKYASQYTIDIYDSQNGISDNYFIINNNERNNYRLPAYHHMDIGFNYTKTAKKLTHVLNVSIYNLYNNFNIFDVFNDRRYRKDTGEEYYVTKSLTLFPIIPSISYTIQF